MAKSSLFGTIYFVSFTPADPKMSRRDFRAELEPAFRDLKDELEESYESVIHLLYNGVTAPRYFRNPSLASSLDHVPRFATQGVQIKQHLKMRSPSSTPSGEFRIVHTLGIVRRRNKYGKIFKGQDEGVISTGRFIPAHRMRNKDGKVRHKKYKKPRGNREGGIRISTGVHEIKPRYILQKVDFAFSQRIDGIIREEGFPIRRSTARFENALVGWMDRRMRDLIFNQSNFLTTKRPAPVAIPPTADPEAAPASPEQAPIDIIKSEKNYLPEEDNVPSTQSFDPSKFQRTSVFEAEMKRTESLLLSVQKFKGEIFEKAVEQRVQVLSRLTRHSADQIRAYLIDKYGK